MPIVVHLIYISLPLLLFVYNNVSLNTLQVCRASESVWVSVACAGIWLVVACSGISSSPPPPLPGSGDRHSWEGREDGWTKRREE